MKGKCTKGKECDFWHPNQCHFFKAGKCEVDKCAFPHFDPETKIREVQAAAAAAEVKAVEAAADGTKPKAKAKAKDKAGAKKPPRPKSPKAKSPEGSEAGGSVARMTTFCAGGSSTSYSSPHPAQVFGLE